MKTSNTIRTFLTGLCASITISFATNMEAQTPQEIEKIKEAIPEKATATPKKTRKILVFNLTRGFKHDSIPVGAKAFELIGEKTGAYTTVVSEDISMFEQEVLESFDAVLLNNTSGDLFMPPNFKQMSPDDQKTVTARANLLRQNLQNFVSKGKGIIGIHAATDCFYDWKEYGEMMGGYFNGHPWGKVVVKIDEPSHPLNKAFDGKPFIIEDEIYTFKTPYSRENLRILLSVDWDESVKKLNIKGGNREDNDYALSWIRKYGDGRVFYCAFGHQHPIFWNKQIIRHLLDGIQFALGDLEADATPSAKLKK
ncbi:MAG: ThuA domain-containing protein [Verrucomicrobiae bacterium]|nr:ThuA domain-containing protein [Verrucomicrobiae bacterium]